MLFQLVIIIAGYSLGLAIAILLKILGVTFVFSNVVILVLTLPLIGVCIAEAVTMLWTNTPGSMGLGGLVVFTPMIIAGALNVVAALATQRWILPIDLNSGVKGSENLTGWLILLIICCLVSLSLWRFWPTPTARLW